MTTTSVLLDPIKINGLELPNRVLMPAMHLNLTPMGQVTDEMIDFYVARAKGEVGLMIIGYCRINDTAGVPFMLSAMEEEEERLAKLAKAITDAGGRAGLQINHGGGYVHSFMIGGGPAVSASEYKSALTGEMTRALEIDEVKAFVQDFAAAAKRTKDAGFQAVEICASAGYLIGQFLSPKTNTREDEYGGDEAGRMRFGIEVAEAARAAVGPDFPILFRLAGNSFVKGAGGSALTGRFAAALEKAGVDAFDVTGGWHETRVPQLTGAVPPGGLSYLARIVKEAVTVPVVACNRMTTPAEAEKVLSDRHGDMVGLGRALIADADFVAKVRSGQPDEVVHCLACNQGCFDMVFAMQKCRCMTNPIALNEAQYGEPVAAEQKKKVVVIGAGPAGLSLAWSAARRGHGVTVLEKSDGPGGQLALAAAREDKAGFMDLAQDLTGRAILAGAEIRYGTTADVQSVKALEPDVVVIATGARPMPLNIPGVERPLVRQSWDVLADPDQIGDKVVVVGGGATGCEVALVLAERGTINAETVAFLLINDAEKPEEIRRLATEGTRDVTLVEMAPKVGADIGRSTRWTVLQDIKRYGVKTEKATEVLRIEEDGVVVKAAGDSGEEQKLLCDNVVLAAGVVKAGELGAELEAAGLEVLSVGDAKEPRKALDAVHEGFDLGWEL